MGKIAMTIVIIIIIIIIIICKRVWEGSYYNYNIVLKLLILVSVTVAVSIMADLQCMRPANSCLLQVIDLYDLQVGDLLPFVTDNLVIFIKGQMLN